MEQTLYGLIGAKLGHSYSKLLHEQLGGYRYELIPLPTEAEARAFMEKRAFTAINVTIPYKQLVIPYCDEIEPKARAIGAVNTIVHRGGKLYGYNTDYAGFAYLARAHGVDFAGRTVIDIRIAVCRDGGAAEILCASRTGRGGALTYAEAAHRRDVQVIVNTTPCGMYPHVGQCMLDPTAFRRWKPCWMWCTTPSAPSWCCVPPNVASTPPAGLRCWWPRPCTPRSILPGSFLPPTASSPPPAAVCSASWRTYRSSACQ